MLKKLTCLFLCLLVIVYTFGCQKYDIQNDEGRRWFYDATYEFIIKEGQPEYNNQIKWFYGSHGDAYEAVKKFKKEGYQEYPYKAYFNEDMVCISAEDLCPQEKCKSYALQMRRGKSGNYYIIEYEELTCHMVYSEYSSVLNYLEKVYSDRHIVTDIDNITPKNIKKLKELYSQYEVVCIKYSVGDMTVYYRISDFVEGSISSIMFWYDGYRVNVHLKEQESDCYIYIKDKTAQLINNFKTALEKAKAEQLQ